MLVRLLLAALGLCPLVAAAGLWWTASPGAGLAAAGIGEAGVIVFLLLADVFPDTAPAKREVQR